MRFITYLVGFLFLIMGGTNTVIKFAENVHKYAPMALRKMAAGSLHVFNEGSPAFLSFLMTLVAIALALAFHYLAGPPELNAVGRTDRLF